MLIKSYCRITNHSIILDGDRLPDLEKHIMGQKVKEDLDHVFSSMDVDYPSFRNMDDYSKLGF
ncbi:MAG: hypothetical protein WC513_04835, partial [Bacteroidales bacterium]